MYDKDHLDIKVRIVWQKFLRTFSVKFAILIQYYNVII